ncbi:MAG TPA: class II histone deacetylase [Ktedonobacteraceae bacterium]
MLAAQTTGLVFDERFLQHDTGAQASVVTRAGTFQLDPEAHPSATQITRRIKQFLDGSGLSEHMRSIAARAATDQELQAYHTRGYIQGVRAHVHGGPASGAWGEIEEDTPLAPGSFEAALYAVGGGLEATRTVLAGEVHNAYALLRPPGHHALSNRCMGYCIFNNAALAAHYARRVHGLSRILIVDWDVHHGNGTQDAFYADAGVLFLSLHQRNWYPAGCGELEQVGCGAGAGYTVNIPLPPGTGDRGYRAAFEQLVVPIGLQYRPQLIIVSAGQDGSWLDPLARMCLTMAGFRTLSSLLVALAQEVCAGRLVMLQEGGYSAPYTPYCTAGALEPLAGVDLGIVDLYAGSDELERSATIFTRATRAALTRARAWHRQWWRI